MTIFNFQFSILKSGKGFTLIELMIVLSITAVLGTFGIAGFANYNKSQAIQASASEVVTMLSLARSRAQSQVKPAGCIGDLSGYSVKISTPKTYTLYVRCSVGPEIKIDQQDKVLATNLTFSSNVSFFFPIKTGRVQTSGQITISSSDGKTKTIVVNALGGVSVQ